MKRRCSNSRDPVFKHYGGRGITVALSREHGIAISYAFRIVNGLAREVSR